MLKIYIATTTGTMLVSNGTVLFVFLYLVYFWLLF